MTVVSPPPGRWWPEPRRASCAIGRGYATIAAVSEAPAEPADLDLLQRIAARDEGALAAFYDRHSRVAYSVILRVLRLPGEAEDVLQETFVRVWSRAETYDAALGAPGAWMIRIARNRAIDRLRQRQVRRDISVEPAIGPDGASSTPEPETRVTPEVLLHEARTGGALRAALAHLPAAQRALIHAAFYEGYTHQELSARFDLPLGTVKTRIRAGLLALRGHLEHAV